MGLTAGPVPTRVDAGIKAGLLELVDHAVAGGWSVAARARARAATRRLSRWQRTAAAGRPLDDAPPGPAEPLHALLDWERDAIVELFESGPRSTARTASSRTAGRGSRRSSCPNPAFCGCYRPRTWCCLPRRHASRPGREPWPAWVEYRPCQVWGHDFTAFGRAGRDALAILDLVSRKWIATLLVPHGRGESVHVQAIYTRALEAEGLLAEIEARMIAPNADELLPVLLAVSDNGPQMISGTTREFMALHALAMHTGRPGTPTDQAHIE